VKLGIDLDGVCYDFIGAYRHYLANHLGWNPRDCPEPTVWECYTQWNLDVADFVRILNEGVDAGVIFTHGDPYPGSRDALFRLRDAGHTLHVITDRNVGRPGAAQQATAAWLAQHDLPYDSLTFSADKTIVQTDAMIDDKIENYRALDKVGCWSYLLDRPWNQKAGYYQRVADLGEFADRILT
jgi:hypothetical protein